MLDGVDVLVIDLQDIGARIYTYIYTMANCLRACARHGVEVIVRDRPNPIGGEAIEGPTLVSGYESFVGQFPIPMRHGLTMGEAARLFNEYFGIGAKLEVVRMTGWSRAMYADDTDLPWVMPSPNMPTLDSAIVYPGTVLFEGTMASEGRGTTRPFEIVGAPWVHAERFAATMNAHELPGVRFRPAVFEPTFHKHAKTACGGCQIHVRDRRAFKPVVTGAALIQEIRAADPSAFSWRKPPYEYAARQGADRHPGGLPGTAHRDRRRCECRRTLAELDRRLRPVRRASQAVPALLSHAVAAFCLVPCAFCLLAMRAAVSPRLRLPRAKSRGGDVR